MTIQLNPPIPLWTPKGFAHAHVMIDPGIDHDLQWVCFIVATGECWTYLNKDIRLVDNETMGRKLAAVEPESSLQSLRDKAIIQLMMGPDAITEERINAEMKRIRENLKDQ